MRILRIGILTAVMLLVALVILLARGVKSTDNNSELTAEDVRPAPKVMVAPPVRDPNEDLNVRLLEKRVEKVFKDANEAIREGDLGEAERLILSSIEAHPDDADVQVAGNMYLASVRWQDNPQGAREALIACREACLRRPAEYPDPLSMTYMLEGDILRQKGDASKAEALFLEAIQKYPGSTGARGSIARYAGLLEEANRGEELVERMQIIAFPLRNNGEVRIALNVLLKYYQDTGDTAKAKETARQIIETFPEQAEAEKYRKILAK